jgi:hypothetical protein
MHCPRSQCAAWSGRTVPLLEKLNLTHRRHLAPQADRQPGTVMGRQVTRVLQRLREKQHEAAARRLQVAAVQK